MDFEPLLIQNDELKPLHFSTRIDIVDYVKMREDNLPTRVKWDKIKSLIVTKNGRTIWSITEQYLNSDIRPIGILEPPLELMKWILHGTNPFKLK
jgi:hypothetical protein